MDIKYPIPHDHERDYRPFGNADYIPPYNHYKYKSIYEGIIVEMHIVDHCNLNCAQCNHFSPIAEPWYISTSELKQTLTLARNNIPNIKELILLGGEPTLHPNLLEICTIAREIFPFIEIYIFSNGKKLDNVLKDSKEYKKLNISFHVCNYPGYTNNGQVKQLKTSGIGDYCNTRPIMLESIVNENGKENYIDNFYNCGHHLIPCLTLKQDKMFLCPFAAHVRHYFNKANKPYPIQEQDYLLIESIQNDIEKIQDFIFTPKPICAYCQHQSDLVIFSKSFRDLKEYNTSLQQMYFDDYERYLKIINPNSTYLLDCLNPEKNFAFNESDHGGEGYLKQLKNRYDGKIDIIIPYYNMPQDQINQLKNTLKSQTIIKDCCIYLISDNSPNEKDVFYEFINDKDLNCILLKNSSRQGPGTTRNNGLAQSHNPYVLFFDADDYFKDNHGLEELYNNILKGNADICYFIMNSQDLSSQKSNFLVKREYLNKYNIQYSNLYFGEDILFLLQMQLYQSKENTTNLIKDIAVYNLANNNTNLTSECTNRNIIYFSLLAVRFLFINKNKNYSIPENMIEEIIQFANNFIYNRDKLISIFAFYLLYNIYKSYPKAFNEQNCDFLTLYNLQNNEISLTTEHSILQTEQDIIIYLINKIKIYSNNEFFIPIAQLILQELGECNNVI